MKRLKSAHLLQALCAALILGGCGGGNSAGGGSSASGGHSSTPRLPDPVPSVTAPDPGRAGPYAVQQLDYHFGRVTVSDETTGDSYQSDVHGYVSYPEGAAGARPVLLFMHGRHQTCETGLGQLPVPVGDDNCPPLSPAITPANSYRGYDYLARNLTSHGYVVLSIDVNDVNDNDGSAGSSDTGALARAMLVLHHLDVFREVNANGGSDGNGVSLETLKGRLDLAHIGIMGHSRGGEGVDKTVRVNRTRTDAPSHGIVAVFALAPTDYLSQHVDGVAFATLLPYCDGDVEDLMGAHAYDRARYEDPDDPYPKFQILAMGANHNYFNTVWTSDDWTIRGSATDAQCGEQAVGNGRDTPEGQRALGLFFMASFFRAFVGGEAEYRTYWSGQGMVPASACPNGVAPCEERYHLAIHAPAQQRLVISDTLTDGSLSQNNLGGAVTLTGFESAVFCEPEGRSGRGCTAAEPTFQIAPQLALAWAGPAAYRTELLGSDVTPYQILSFRMGASLGDSRNADGQDLTVVLEDAAGHRAAVRAGEYTSSLYYPPGDEFYGGGSRKTMLNGIDIPLRTFQGIDFTNLSALELVFDQTPAGTVQLTDILFERVP